MDEDIVTGAYELHDVIAFEMIASYTLYLKFDDGKEQVVNFEPILIGPLFGELRDLTLFNQVILDEFGTLEWPNGADIDPMVLYNWPDHVNRIVARRQALFEAPVQATMNESIR
ncbi:MAG: DUF2442 domain-containing protein [Chloroflexota bacterium]